ncbi:MAG: MFS transporter, partial [Leptospiraceae bacterium]|nr:MFS transporter [Leptospiraceae bacterium]
MGSNLSSLSPYVLSNFGEKGEWIFICIQVSMPIGTLFAGWISDKTKKIRIFSILGISLLFPTQYFLFSFPHNWITTAILAGFQRFLLSANYQWVIIGAIEEKGENRFSKIRSSGTFGFLIIQFILYLLTTIELPFSISDPSETGKLGSYFYIFCFPFCFKLPRKRISHLEYRFKDALNLLKDSNLRMFFIYAFIFYSAYQVTDNYLGRYFQIYIGLDSVYLSWFIAVILEIPFLFLVSKISLRYGIFSLFYLSLIFGFLRYSLLSVSVVGINKNLLLSFQAFHSILFAGFYMGTILWLRKVSPPHLYGSLYGLYSIFA